MSEYFSYWFLLLVCLAWVCASMMDTIQHHQHSSWIFKLNLPESVKQWLKSDWKERNRYLFNLYDGWHSFKGAMLIFQALAIISISVWYNGLIYLLSYFIIQEGLYGYILKRK